VGQDEPVDQPSAYYVPSIPSHSNHPFRTAQSDTPSTDMVS
jgi:hypothetical protein